MQSFFTKNDTKFVKAVLKLKKEREKKRKDAKKNMFCP